ncbi:MAG: ribonuclease R, partial [Ignavibacteria bacterium]|nr:ribonuclease R [Ignavibacteria bacterium]
TMVGRLEKSGHFFFVVPDDDRMRRDVYVPREEAERASTGDKVVVRLAPWTDPHLNPEGSIIENLGPSGNAHAEVLSVARTFGLPEAFPDAVEAEAARFPEQPTRAELASRLDMRSITCFTIDPVDAQDFDDALSIERLKNGHLRLGVHIADVSHFVRQGSGLDREAYERGTSVYMVNEVVPMLPERLSNDLCSLRPDVDRLTFSVMMELNEHGTVGSYEIRKSIIHSAKRFTYEEAEEVLKTGNGPYRDELQLLQKLAKALYRKRRAKGSLDFDTPEVKFHFDAGGLPDKILKKERLESNRLVEECMLLANVTVARHIGAGQKDGVVRPFVYRIHDSPDPDRIKDLSNFVKQFGYSLDVKSGVPTRALQGLLDQVRGSEVETLINKVALRSMAKAIYSPDSYGHYGLGFRHYTHFTSPIRRYPDLIVHRLLEEYEKPVSNERLDGLKEITAATAAKASMRERVAVEAERASVKVMQVEYMKRHIGDVLDGVIGGVADFGIFVEVNDLQIEGLVRVRDLSDDYYMFDERQYALKGRSNGRIFRLGDRVKVRVISVNDREQQIDMLIVP